ncbi:MAG: DUF21 domain-containing protein [Thermoguttaceae bacterium]|nr:DUF21 domain-containing protein [Thermoguttaceae bacterium]
MSDVVTWQCIFVVSLLAAVLVSALCSIAESVLLSLTMAQVEEINEKNSSIGKIWEIFKQDVDTPITCILAINTIAHTIGASFAGVSFAKLFGETWIGLFSLVFTFFMLQYTEILPKTLGVRFNNRIAYWIARPLRWTITICDPFIHFLRYLNKPFESSSPELKSLNTVEEISLLALLAKRQRQLNSEQEVIINGALKLSEIEVDRVKVSIKDVAMLADDLTPAEAFEIAKNDTHTRFPVYYRTNKELIIGYVNFKELALSEIDISGSSWNTLGSSASADLSKFIRPIINVESTDRASDVLSTLVRNHEHIALVIDAVQKKPVGILTLEDIVEELLGEEIEDEFDYLPETLYDYMGMIRAGGGVSLKDVKLKVEEVFPVQCEAFVREITLSEARCLSEWLEKEKLHERVTRNSRVNCGKLSIGIKRVRRGHISEVVILAKD